MAGALPSGSDPSGFDLGDFGMVGAALSDLNTRTRENVENFYRGVVQGSAGWGSASDILYEGLSILLPFPAALLQGVIEAITGILPGGQLVSELLGELGSFFFEKWQDLTDIIEDLIEFVTGLVGSYDIDDVIDLLLSPFDLINNLAGAVIEGLTGIVDLDLIPDGDLLSVIVSALQSIPFANIIGIGGPSNIGEAIQETWNQLVGGLVGALGTGASLADLFNISNLVSSWASLGRLAFDILGIRSNKPLTSGLLATSESTFSLTEVAAGSTPPTIAVTQSNAVIGFQRISESATKRVVSWLGSGVNDITEFYVRIWQMDTDTGDMALVYESENIAGDLFSTLNWHIHELDTPLEVQPSEVYGIELAVVGTGTHQVVGRETWLPDHPAVYPKNLAATRNSGTDPAPETIASESVVYSTDVPWIEFGIEANPVAYHTADVRMFNSDSQVVIPTWAAEVDVIALGGGGGGHQGGTWGISGEGGDAGQWQTDTWVRDGDFTSGAIVDIVIGAGGEGGGGSGASGGSTVVSIADGPTLTAPGGAGGDSLQFGGANRQGKGPGNLTYRGYTFVGGVAQSAYGRDGNPPGGGGSGGDWIAASLGGDGANGVVWLVFRPGSESTPEVEPPAAEPESYSDDFNRSNSPTLGPDWVAHDPLGNGRQLSIRNNQATAEDAFDAVVSEYASPMATDDHSVTIKVGSKVPITLWICLRSNGTDAVVAELSGLISSASIKAQVGMSPTYNFDSATTVGSTSGSQGSSMSPGDEYTFEVVGQMYALKKNGSTFLTWNGASYSGYVNSSHRRVAIGLIGVSECSVDDFEAKDI